MYLHTPIPIPHLCTSMLLRVRSLLAILFLAWSASFFQGNEDSHILVRCCSIRQPVVRARLRHEPEKTLCCACFRSWFYFLFLTAEKCCLDLILYAQIVIEK